MTVNFPGLVQILQYRVAGLS